MDETFDLRTKFTPHDQLADGNWTDLGKNRIQILLTNASLTYTKKTHSNEFGCHSNNVNNSRNQLVSIKQSSFRNNIATYSRIDEMSVCIH